MVKMWPARSSISLIRFLGRRPFLDTGTALSPASDSGVTDMKWLIAFRFASSVWDVKLSSGIIRYVDS